MERDHSSPGERNPSSAAQARAQLPPGENARDASMMAELIVTKKEIGSQLQKSAPSLAGQHEMPWCGWSKIAVGGNTWGRAFDCLVPWFGGAFGGGVRSLRSDAG